MSKESIVQYCQSILYYYMQKIKSRDSRFPTQWTSDSDSDQCLEIAKKTGPILANILFHARDLAKSSYNSRRLEASIDQLLQDIQNIGNDSIDEQVQIIPRVIQLIESLNNPALSDLLTHLLSLNQQDPEIVPAYYEPEEEMKVSLSEFKPTEQPANYYFLPSEQAELEQEYLRLVTLFYNQNLRASKYPMATDPAIDQSSLERALSQATRIIDSIMISHNRIQSSLNQPLQVPRILDLKVMPSTFNQEQTVTGISTQPKLSAPVDKFIGDQKDEQKLNLVPGLSQQNFYTNNLNPKVLVPPVRNPKSAQEQKVNSPQSPKNKRISIFNEQEPRSPNLPPVAVAILK